MAIAAEGLQLVRENPDGSLQWQEQLVAPGAPGSQSAILANLDMATEVLGATQFKMTDSGDWIATCKGITYNVLPGVIPKTGQFVFIGIPIRGGNPLGDPNNVRPTFDGKGSLTATIRGWVSPTPDFSSVGNLTAVVVVFVVPDALADFDADGELAALVHRAGELVPSFAGEGSLTATRTKVRQRTRAPRFRSAGRLTATVVELVGEQVAATLAGEGSLSATATVPRPVDPPIPGGAVMSKFFFEEGSGPTAESDDGVYTLTTTNSDANAWWTGSIVGHFTGVVGHGLRDAWSLEPNLDIWYLGRALRIEGGCDETGVPWTVGLAIDASGHLGLYDNVTGQWVYGTNVMPTDQRDLRYVSDPVANTTTVYERISGANVTLPHATIRDFDAPAEWLPDGSNDIGVKLAAYYGHALSPWTKAKT